MLDARLDQGNKLILVTTKTLCHKRSTQFHGKAGQVNPFKSIDRTRLADRTKVSRCRILSFGQAITAIIHDDIDHIQVSADDMDKLSHSDGGRITITGYPYVNQIFICQIGSRSHTGHTAMHRIESVRAAQKISRCFGRTANAGHFSNSMWRNIKLKAGKLDSHTYAVMPTAST